MGGLGKLAIRRPPIAHEHAVEIRSEHGGRFVEAAPRLNPIDGGVPRGKGPEPLQQTGDLPAGFIRSDHRTAAHAGTERVVRRARLPGRAMDRVHEPATRHRQAVQLLQERHNLAERQSPLFIEDDDQRDHLRAELRGRGAEGIGGLQRMSPLHPPPAAVAAAHMNVKLPDDHTRDRQFFLVLCRDARRCDPAGTAGTVRRESNLVPLVHARWTPPTCLQSIRAARLSAWPLRILFQRLGKRRGLSESRPPRIVQLSFQVIEPMAEPFGFPLQLVTLTSQRVADRKSTRLNSSHSDRSRMPSSA